MEEIKHGLLIQGLSNLKADAEEIVKKAQCAREIIEKVDELVELLKELHS